MVVVALDTHAVVKELQAAGFTEAQAEAVTRAVRQSGDVDLSGFATKADGESARRETKADVEALRKELKADIEGLRKDLTADIEGLRKDLTADIEGLRKDLTADIEGLRKEFKADIGGLRRDTRADLEAAKFEILKWVIGAMGVQTVALLGALVALTRGFRP